MDILVAMLFEVRVQAPRRGPQKGSGFEVVGVSLRVTCQRWVALTRRICKGRVMAILKIRGLGIAASVRLVRVAKNVRAAAAKMGLGGGGAGGYLYYKG
jgi:hypothetical protein